MPAYSVLGNAVRRRRERPGGTASWRAAINHRPRSHAAERKIQGRISWGYNAPLTAQQYTSAEPFRIGIRIGLTAHGSSPRTPLRNLQTRTTLSCTPWKPSAYRRPRSLILSADFLVAHGLDCQEFLYLLSVFSLLRRLFFLHFCKCLRFAGYNHWQSRAETY